MRFNLIFFFVLSCRLTYAQDNYFDSELGHDSYEWVSSKLVKERIVGNVKEIRVISDSGIGLHLKLNKEGQITDEYEYTDSARLIRAVKYANQKIVSEVEYYKAKPYRYIFYEYDKRGNLIETDFSKDKRNRSQTTRVTYQYDVNDRLVLRNYNSNRGGFTKFIYEGDSVAWKLGFSKDSVLKAVVGKYVTEGMVRIITYRLDTLSKKPFTQRIKPRREYLSSWNENKSLREWQETEVDTSGNRLVKEQSKHVYDGHKLIKSTTIHNAEDLKGEFIYEYKYDSQGRKIAEISTIRGRSEEKRYEYDEHGNQILQAGIRYRFLYDQRGNWISKELLAKSVTHTVTRNGVAIKKDNDIVKREIIYFN